MQRYTANEILEFFRADYRQRVAVDNMVSKNQNLSFATTINDWREICDLLEVEDLCKPLNHWFNTDISEKEWMTILKNEHDNTLEDLCVFITEHAIKIEIHPRKLLGKECLTAGIFKTLITELEKRNVDIKNIRPSSNLESIMLFHFSEVINVVNLLNPKVLPPVDFESNETYQAGDNLIIWAILMTSLAYFFSKLLAAIILLAIFNKGITLMNKGAELPPKKMRFAEIETVGDLARKISYQK